MDRFFVRGRARAARVAAVIALLSACTGRTGGPGGKGEPGVAPSVSVHPASAVVREGDPASFTVTAQGTAPLTYQWQRDGADVAGATGASYTISRTALSDSGAAFRVVVSNAAGSVTSRAAILTVGTAPPDAGSMTTANRTAGVAPLAVFFDAVDDVDASAPTYTYAWTTGVTQPADMEGALHAWDFGDPGSGTWATTGKSKNTATGFTAAHVFEAPGTYEVTLVVTTALGTSSTFRQTITVADPETVYAATTRYVAAGGSDAAAGTQAAPYATIDRAMSDVSAGRAKRVLLRRGDTFSMSTTYTIASAGPGHLGAYGTGAKPIIDLPDMGEAEGFTTAAGIADWRFVDLDFRVGGSGSSLTGAVGAPTMVPAKDMLMLRISTRGSYVGFGWNYWGDQTAAGSPHDGMFVVDCDEPVQPGAYGAYTGGRRLAMLGNHLLGGVGWDAHAMRVWQAHKAVISQNHVERAGIGRHALKLVGPEQALHPVMPQTRWVSITDNVWDSGTTQWTVSFGSQSDAESEASYCSHIVFERNLITAGVNTVIGLQSESAHTMVRNNVFDLSPVSGADAMMWQQRNTYIPAPSDVRLYNNTVYGADAFLATGATLTNASLRNNLVVTPGRAPALTSGTPGTGCAQDHNLLSAAAAATVFTDAAARDFALAAGSPAVDAGAPLSEVARDYLGQVRPRGAGWDLGAVESR